MQFSFKNHLPKPNETNFWRCNIEFPSVTKKSLYLSFRLSRIVVDRSDNLRSGLKFRKFQ